MIVKNKNLIIIFLICIFLTSFVFSQTNEIEIDVNKLDQIEIDNLIKKINTWTLEISKISNDLEKENISREELLNINNKMNKLSTEI